MISQNNVILLTTKFVPWKSASKWSYLLVRGFFKNVWQAAQKVNQVFDNELYKSKTDSKEIKNIAASLYRDLMKAFEEYKEMRKHAAAPEPLEPPLTLQPIKPEKS